MWDTNLFGALLMINRDSRILVVDDFELMRRMLKTALADLGIPLVTECVDGLQASEVMRKAWDDKQPFHLVFCDWNMPNMSGLELLALVRADLKMRDVPFIMVTAEADRSQVVQALQSGATDYIVKPLSLDTIRKKFESLNKKLAAKS